MTVAVSTFNESKQNFIRMKRTGMKETLYKIHINIQYWISNSSFIKVNTKDIGKCNQQYSYVHKHTAIYLTRTTTQYTYDTEKILNGSIRILWSTKCY